MPEETYKAGDPCPKIQTHRPLIENDAGLLYCQDCDLLFPKTLTETDVSNLPPARPLPVGKDTIREEHKAIAEKHRQELLVRIDKDFTYHSPNPDQVERYQLIRDTAKKLARVMVEVCPHSRELSSALTSLETAVMQANASIARNE